MIVKPKIVQKGWGEEVWIHNDEEYCGKLLRFFKAGNKFSLHYHIIKKESWYVGKGSFEYIWLDTEKGIEHTTTILPGTCITIERGYMKLPFKIMLEDPKSKHALETVTNPYSGQSCQLPRYAVAVYDTIKGAEVTGLSLIHISEPTRPY